MSEIYKNVLKIKKIELALFLITFLYVLLKNLLLEKFANFYFFAFIFEIYLTVSVYTGIKKSVFNELFNFSDIFKDGLKYFFPILLYNLLIGVSGGIVYLIITNLINSIKTFNFYSIFLFVLIISWASVPFFFLLLTIYAPFIIMIDDVPVFTGINKSVNFLRGNLPNLISLFSPFLIFWFLFFTFYPKYDKIIPLKIVLLFLSSFLEILTIKLVFLVYKGENNERNF